LCNECVSMGQRRIDPIEKRTVTVLRLPEQFGADTGRDFIRDVEECVNAGRPYLVLDCSAASQLDKPLTGLLLHCLEEAMKRNGDVRLACISMTRLPASGLVGAIHLFEIFDTVEDAFRSFHQFSIEIDAEDSESAA
jgi:anti-sigma B factor antagonist